MTNKKKSISVPAIVRQNGRKGVAMSPLLNEIAVGGKYLIKDFDKPILTLAKKKDLKYSEAIYKLTDLPESEYRLFILAHCNFDRKNDGACYVTKKEAVDILGLQDNPDDVIKPLFRLQEKLANLKFYKVEAINEDPFLALEHKYKLIINAKRNKTNSDILFTLILSDKVRDDMRKTPRLNVNLGLLSTMPTAKSKASNLFLTAAQMSNNPGAFWSIEEILGRCFSKTKIETYRKTRSIHKALKIIADRLVEMNEMNAVKIQTRTKVILKAADIRNLFKAKNLMEQVRITEIGNPALKRKPPQLRKANKPQETAPQMTEEQKIENAKLLG